MSAVRIQEIPLGSSIDVGQVPPACIGRRSGRLVAFVDGGSSISIWSLGRKQPKQKLHGHEGASVTAVAFPQREEFLVSGGSDGSVIVWDTQFGKIVRAMSHEDTESAFGGGGGKKSPVTCIVFGPACRADIFASAASDGTVALWDLGARKAALTRFVASNTEITALRFLPDANRLLVADRKGCVTLWNLSSGKLDAEMLPANGLPVRALEICPAGRWLAMLKGESKVMIWDTDALKLRHEFDLPNRVDTVHFPPVGMVITHTKGIQVVYLPPESSNVELSPSSFPMAAPIVVNWNGCRDVHVTPDFQMLGCELTATGAAFWLCSLHSLKQGSGVNPPLQSSSSTPVAIATAPAAPTGVPQNQACMTSVDRLSTTSVSAPVLDRPATAPAALAASSSNDSKSSSSTEEMLSVAFGKEEKFEDQQDQQDQEDQMARARRPKRKSIVPQSPKNTSTRTSYRHRMSMIPTATNTTAATSSATAISTSASTKEFSSSRGVTASAAAATAVAPARTTRSSTARAAAAAAAAATGTTTSTTALSTAASSSASATATTASKTTPSDAAMSTRENATPGSNETSVPQGLKASDFFSTATKDQNLTALLAEHDDFMAVMAARQATITGLMASLGTYDNGTSSQVAPEEDAVRLSDGKRTAVALISTLQKIPDPATATEAISLYLKSDPALSFSVCALLLTLLTPALALPYEPLVYKALRAADRMLEWAQSRHDSGLEGERPASVQKYRDSLNAAQGAVRRWESSSGPIGNLARSISTF